ncbi:MAG TPA: hypothetical protein VLJ76_02925 [Gaiellaceae bacterium]|nr:hypothetical protein [Gaiellaceae bacterium]
MSTRFGIATGAFIEERDDWLAAIAKATREDWPCVELTAIHERRLDDLVAFLNGGPDALRPFERVSIHAPVLFETTLPEVIEKLDLLPPSDLVVHPDVYADADLARLGSRVVVENMDVQKRFGRSLADLVSAFDAWPQAGFCLDVAHVLTNDPSLRLADELLAAFDDRLRQLHVSGIEPDGTHRTTTAADLDLYRPVLERCRHVPWILEGVLEEPGLASFGT